MSQSLRYHAGQPNEDWIQRNESEPQAWVPPMHGELVDGGRFYYKSCNEQKIAMTGSWCQALPGSGRICHALLFQHSRVAEESQE